MDIKQGLIDALDVLLKDRQAKGEVWKVKAYKKALSTIRAFDGPIKDAADVEALKLGKGAIADKAMELLATGQVHAVKLVDAGQIELNDAMDLLQGVAGIGQVKARELVMQHGVRTIDDLRADETVLNEKQRIGLRYYENFKARIPRAEMNKHAALMAAVIPEVHAGITYEITGSYRRNEKDSGDIDVLITCADPEVCRDGGATLITAIVEKLKAGSYLYETLAKGDKKYMGVCKLKRHQTYRRFDLIFAAPETYPFTLLYFTGSATFNILMRNHALANGYSLSEYGLKSQRAGQSDADTSRFRTEEDIFAFLGLAYTPPDKRTKTAKLELL